MTTSPAHPEAVEMAAKGYLVYALSGRVRSSYLDLVRNKLRDLAPSALPRSR